MIDLIIEDMFGNTIKVTDLNKAIEETSFLSESDFAMNPFRHEYGNDQFGKRVVHEREIGGEPTTVGEYNSFLLKSLIAIKKEGKPLMPGQRKIVKAITEKQSKV